MYLHLGGNITVKTQNIVGIFDMDTTTVSKITRNFLSDKEKSKKLVYATYDLPKSFCITSNGKSEKIFVTQLSSKTLVHREQNIKELRQKNGNG